MRFIEQEDPQFFDQFSKSEMLAHYTKTSSYANFCAKRKIKTQLVSLRNDDNQIVATALIQWKKIAGMKFGYICYGFNLDYTKQAILSTMSTELRNLAMRQHAVYIHMELNVPRRQHEQDGTVSEHGWNHEYVVDWLCACGWKHLGYNYGYSGNIMSRFTYINHLDSDWEQIKKGIKHATSLENKNKIRALEVRQGDIADIKTLVKAEKELAKKLHFIIKKEDYFQDLVSCFKDEVRLYVVSADYHKAIDNLKDWQQQLLEQQVQIKNSSRLKQLDTQIQAIQKEIKEIEKVITVQSVQRVELGVKLIIHQKDHVYNVNMYTLKTLPNFRAAFALHRAVLEDCYKKKARTYDFEGVSGALNQDDPYYGIHEFKKSFGGEFVEFLGDFDCLIDPQKYKMIQLIQRLKRKLKKLILHWSIHN